jgi:glycosyltransferase involved in cell wall biosynthesis
LPHPRRSHTARPEARLRILLVNDYGTPGGGAEIATHALRQALRRRGHDARVFASVAGSGGANGFADYRCFGTTSRFRTLLQTANPSAYWRLRRTLADFAPDVVHVRLFLTQLSPLILLPLRDVPSLHHVVWHRPFCPVGTKALPDGSPCTARWGVACLSGGCLPARDWIPLMAQMKLWERWRPAFKLFVANCESLRAHLLEHGIGPVELIPNGVPVRPPRAPLRGPPLVAFAGRLVGQKGAAVLLRAFALLLRELPEARLVLAGDGPERESLGRLSGELRVASRVEMTGHLPRGVLEQLLDAAWVQAVPSSSGEAFASVAVEAMMRGTAVVASRCGGLGEIVRHGVTGWLVPAGDPAALAAALLRLLRDRELAEEMGRAGRELALRCYGEDACTDRFVEAYQRLAARRSSRLSC